MTRHEAPSVHAEVVSSPPEALPTPIDRELLADFLAECCEHVQHIEMALLTLETDPDDRAAIDTALRACHTIKGTAAFLRCTPMVDLAHHTESLLSRMRDGEIRCTGGYADLALRAADMPKEWARALQHVLAGAALVPPCRLQGTVASPGAGRIQKDQESQDLAVGLLCSLNSSPVSS